MTQAKNDYKVDSEFDKLVPRPTKGELINLRASIEAEGLRDEIVVWNGLIIDGMNRYRICKELGVTPKFKELSFSCREEVKEWIVNNQLARRNLSLFAKAELVISIHDVVKLQAEAKANQGKRNDLATDSQGSSESESVSTRLAKIAGIGTQTMSRVLKIREKASDAQKNDLRDGKTTINALYEEVKHTRVKKEEPPTDDAGHAPTDAPIQKVVSEKELLIEIVDRFAEKNAVDYTKDNTFFYVIVSREQLNKEIREINSMNNRVQGITFLLDDEHVDSYVLMVGKKKGKHNMPEFKVLNNRDRVSTCLEVSKKLLAELEVRNELPLLVKELVSPVSVESISVEMAA